MCEGLKQSTACGWIVCRRRRAGVESCKAIHVQERQCTLQEALQEERVKVAAALEAERARTGGQAGADSADQPGPEADAAADPLDAYMTGVASAIELDKVKAS